MSAIDDPALNLVISNYDKLIVMVFKPNVNSVCTMFGSMFNSEQRQIFLHKRLSPVDVFVF